MPDSFPAFGRLLLISAIVVGWVGFQSTSSRLEKILAPSTASEMQVALPKFIQVLLAGGDRFLAANISVFRALTTDTMNQKPERFSVQAILQDDASWFNPRHEDNYYLASAHLPWNGQIDTAQKILLRASETRKFDFLPPFFYAFNEIHFRHDPISGAHWMKVAADHAIDEKNRISLEKVSARWAEKGQDRHEVIRMLDAMAKQSRYKFLRHSIELRAERVRNLILLDEAIHAYHMQNHTYPASLQELTTTGFLPELPHDPFNQPYIIDARGYAQIKPQQNK